jgi:hypothetical protein
MREVHCFLFDHGATVLWVRIRIRWIHMFLDLPDPDTSLFERSGSESGSVSKWYGSTDPDPYQNVTDPQHL